MSVPLRVLVATDSFPPVCGGSGWSTWELVRGLAGRGHHVEVVKIDTGPGPSPMNTPPNRSSPEAWSLASAADRWIAPCHERKAPANTQRIRSVSV